MTELAMLFLILVANGAPVIATRLCGMRAAWPLDAGWTLADGQRLLGASKTWRGLVSALFATAVAAHLLGWSWQIGLTIAAAAMAGDLLSSFCKRRLELPSSSQALGVDQIPEALFPMLAVHGTLGLGTPEVIALTIAFVVLELALSRILYRLNIRREPY